jgi:hypothetical protein
MIANFISGNCFFQSLIPSDMSLYDFILKYHGALNATISAHTSWARISACSTSFGLISTDVCTILTGKL